ncbi:MAG: hypothetical protein EZS28_012561 [Streblomastix strix]|uniref:Uncharacterized protein n=1 Tax=Streblomastix strix TaxID=222440 RepID=A0A5J4WBJ0_9EUKA|nr:MAG: hypothetical protein EZS28_012561 [Streblomastix strix]
MSYLLSLSGSNHSNPQNHSPIQRPNHNHPINIHPLSHSSPLNIKQSTNQYKQSHTNTSSPHPIPQSPNHPNQSQSQSTSTSILPSQSLPQQSNNSSSSSSYSSSSSTSHPISSTDNSSSSSSSSSSSYSSSSHNLITPFLHINKSLTGNGDSNLTTLEVIQETFIEEIQKLEPKEEIVIKPPYPLRVIRQKIPKKSKPVIVQTSSSNQTSPSLLQNPTKDQSMNTSVPQNEDKNETESEIESRKKKKRITRKYKKIVKEGDSETMSNQSEKQMKENINIGEDDDNVLKMKNKKILIRGHSTPLPNRIPLSSLLFVLSPSLLVSPSIQPLLSMQEKEREQLEQHHKEEDELLLKHKLIEKVILGRKEKKELEDQLLNHENERYQNERRRMVENRQMNEQQINNEKEKETYNKDQLNQKNEQESIKDDKGEQKSEKKWKLKSRKRRWRREVENSQSANEEQ